ncbi:hypothetical protein BVRB_6g136040 [Beta vulgaris subsp. vulgaris]|nr:hypothetical protein BVRB_6g136040 [Beta vulgaris subsp. vulgaris]
MLLAGQITKPYVGMLGISKGEGCCLLDDPLNCVLFLKFLLVATLISPTLHDSSGLLPHVD